MSASLISSNLALRKQLRALLQPEGFKVRESLSLIQATDQLRQGRFRLVILDLDSAAQGRHEALKALKKASRAPLIALSEKDDDADIVNALEQGADDFIRMPFNPRVLLARIYANLRMLRPAVPPPAISLVNGPIRIDSQRHEARIAGGIIPFSPKEFEILRRLVAGRGEPLANKELLRDVWGPAHINDNQYLRVYMSQLRKKLEPAGLHTAISYSRHGYRMDVLVGD